MSMPDCLKFKSNLKNMPKMDHLPKYLKKVDFLKKFPIVLPRKLL